MIDVHYFPKDTNQNFVTCFSLSIRLWVIQRGLFEMNFQIRCVVFEPINCENRVVLCDNCLWNAEPCYNILFYQITNFFRNSAYDFASTHLVK